MKTLSRRLSSSVPDIWFDLYARLLPGLGFVLAFIAMREINLFELGPTTVATSVVVGFLIGHVIQPFSSQLAFAIETREGIGDVSVQVDKLLDARSRQILVLSKQHAECASMAAFCLLSAFFFLICLLNLLFPSTFSYFTGTTPKWTISLVAVASLAGVPFFYVGAVGRAKAIRRRSDRYLSAYATTNLPRPFSEAAIKKAPAGPTKKARKRKVG